jgi:hypothetical protein
VRHWQRARQVGQEDDARLQGGDQQRVPARVPMRELGAELLDPARDLVAGEIDLPDRVPGGRELAG